MCPSLFFYYQTNHRNKNKNFLQLFLISIFEWYSNVEYRECKTNSSFSLRRKKINSHFKTSIEVENNSFFILFLELWSSALVFNDFIFLIAFYKFLWGVNVYTWGVNVYLSIGLNQGFAYASNQYASCIRQSIKGKHFGVLWSVCETKWIITFHIPTATYHNVCLMQLAYWNNAYANNAWS